MALNQLLPHRMQEIAGWTDTEDAEDGFRDVVPPVCSFREAIGHHLIFLPNTYEIKGFLNEVAD